jgi:hypothetical protein
MDWVPLQMLWFDFNEPGFITGGLVLFQIGLVARGAVEESHSDL